MVEYFVLIDMKFIISRTIYAFDKDKKRLTTMKSLCQRAGASCLRLRNADFLRINPQDPQYSNVGYILVDPSCSGSGKKAFLGFNKHVFCFNLVILDSRIGLSLISTSMALVL